MFLSNGTIFPSGSVTLVMSGKKLPGKPKLTKVLMIARFRT